MSAIAMSAALESEPEALPAYLEKELLRLVVVGSVDDGKSTLIGRLLYDCNGLYEDQVAAVRRASAGGEIDFSLFTDGLRAEREQGITIDVAYRYFATGKRQVIVADTPGHLQYTRNMATGASTADAAVILVDARLGILSQTRRHAYLAGLLGIPYLAVAINKMDLLGFDRAVFDRIAKEFLAFAKGLGFEQVRLFPVSAVDGDNITRRSARTPWHDGGSLLEWLESLPGARRLDRLPLRLPVQYVLRPDLNFRGFAGQLASGSLRQGDEVMVLPSGRRSRVASIETFDGSLAEEHAPASVAIRLADEVDVSRGDVIVHADQRPSLLGRLEATLVWFAEKPLEVGRRYLVKHGARYVSAQVDEVAWRKELETLTEVPAESLSLNEIGLVRITCKQPLIADAYRENRQTGAFILVDPLSNDTVAAGMIVGAVENGGAQTVRSRISSDERAKRLGQKGALVVLPPSPSAAEEAVDLERALFDRGLHVVAVRHDAEMAIALAEAGLVALLHVSNAAGWHAQRGQVRGSGVTLLELEAGEGASQRLERVLATQAVTR